MDKNLLTQKIKDKALELGFARVGITTADDFETYAAEVPSAAPHTPCSAFRGNPDCDGQPNPWLRCLPGGLPALKEALAVCSPMVREAAAWALERI